MGRTAKRGFSYFLAMILTLGTIISGSGMTIAKADESDQIQVTLTGNQPEALEQGAAHLIHVDGQFDTQEEVLLRIYLWDDQGNPEQKLEIPESKMDEILSTALIISGNRQTLLAQWKTEANEDGQVTARYLEGAIPAGASFDFNLEFSYETEETTYQKVVTAEARAFRQETEIGIRGTNKVSFSWSGESSEEVSTAINSTDSDSYQVSSPIAAVNGAIKEAQVDESISKMFHVPVTYYDYLDDNEIKNGWKKPQPYGNNQSQGWTVFGLFNKELANFGSAYSQATPLYFGNLLSTDRESTGSARAKEVAGHLEWLRTFYPPYDSRANNSNYLSDFHVSAQGLVYNTLDENGNLQIKDGTRAPWFDENFLNRVPESTGETYVDTLGKVISSRFPFRTLTENGISYYEFDSNNAQDNVRYHFDTNTFSYGAGSGYGVQDFLKANWGLSTSDNGGYGFFPFNSKSGTGNDNWLDYGFGTKLDIRFNLPKNGTVKNQDGKNVPIKFEFTGDDDVWVFVDGKLVLDLGGAHKKAQGTIDFSTLSAYLTTGTQTINYSSNMNAVTVAEALDVKNSDELRPEVGHTLTIFYMERGMIESNLKIRFNMQPLADEFITEKRVETADINAGIQDVVQHADNFNVTLKTGNDIAAKKEYQLNSGSTGETELGLYTDSNGSYSLSDGDQTVFKQQFSDYKGQVFTAEEAIPEDSTFTYRTHWEAVDLENVNSLIQSGEGTTAAFPYDKTAGDEFTPVRNKLIYYNTPETTSLDITKSAVDKDGNPYVDTDTEFEFEVLLDIGEIGGGITYEQDITDPYTIYFQKPDSWNSVNAYCYGENGSKNNIWPGEAMTLVKDNIYKLDSAKKYTYVVFNNGGINSGNQLPTTGGYVMIPPKTEEIGEGASRNCYLKDGSLSSSIYRETQSVTEPGSLLVYQPYQITYIINGISHQADEQGVIKLKAGETASIMGLPVGTRFKVKERNTSGYSLQQVTINDEAQTAGVDGYYEGGLTGGQSKKTTLSFVNQKEITFVSINAHKTLDNGQLPGPKSFNFNLIGQGSRLLPDGAMSMDTSDIQLNAYNDSEGKVPFDTLTYTEEGTYIYQISEEIPENSDYLYDKTVYELTVVVTSSPEGDYQVDTVLEKIKDRDGIEITPIIIADVEQGILFNNLNNLEDLIIEKQLIQEDGTELPRENWPVSGEDFWFKIELRQEDGTYEPLSLEEFKVDSENRRTDKDGVFSLKATEKALFKDIVISSKYRVTELLNSYVYSWDYELKDIIVNHTTLDSDDSSTGEQVIVKGDNQVIFRNYPLNKIQIIKMDENQEPLAGAGFKLEVNKGRPESPDWQVVTGYENQVSDDQGAVGFDKLHAGQYRITEIKTIEGYILLKDPIIIALPYEYKAGDMVNGIEVEEGGLTYTVKFTISNGQSFDLPKSGTKGVILPLIVGAACLSFAGMEIYLRIRRRKLSKS